MRSLVPLKYLAAINEKALPETTADDFEFRYVDIGSVGRGELATAPEKMRFQTAPSRARRKVRAGDTLVSTVRTYLRAVLPIREDADDLIASTAFAVITPHGIDSRYFGWWAQSDVFIEDVVARSVGVSYPAINALELGDLPVRVPPLAEQRAIADYLDAETARIDALIAKKQQLIHLLEERWRGFVDTATSGGDAVRVRHVTSLRTSGPRGWADRVGERGQPFIRSGNLTRDSIDLDHRDLARVVAPETAETQRSSTRAGDSLVGITGANTGWVAAVDSSTEAGFVSQHVAILRPAGVEPRWLTYSLFAPRSQDQLLGGQYGGTKTQLGLQDLAELKISLPPRDVQQALLEKLDAERLRRGRLIESVSRQVELLSERRQAMITALVTGARPTTGGLS